jgi:uncharacterized protein (DUF3084 family)
MNELEELEGARDELKRCRSKLRGLLGSDSPDPEEVCKAKVGVAEAKMGVAEVELEEVKAKLRAAVKKEASSEQQKEIAELKGELAKAEQELAKAEQELARADWELAKAKHEDQAEIDLKKMAYERTLSGQLCYLSSLSFSLCASHVDQPN